MKKNGFYAMLARMKHISRWGLMRNSIRENLSEHSYDVAVIAHALALIGQTRFGKDVDPGQIAAAALFHVSPEILTGDMPTPVKYNTPQIREAFRMVEDAAVSSLLRMLPEDLRPRYKVLFSFETDRPELYQYIKAADKISAYIKCLEEQKSGNAEFNLAARQTRQAVEDMRLPEADCFLAEFTPAYSLTLDELQEQDQSEK